MKNKDLYQPDTDFPFSIGRAAGGALKHAGYFRLKQLSKITEAELLKIHGVGPKAVGILRVLLKAQGLSFATAIKPRGKGEASFVSQFGTVNEGRTVSAAAQDVSAVDAFMQSLKHPLKAEVEALCKIIKDADKRIVEEIKWKAPSFSYKGNYLVTFNLRETKRIHLVFHNPKIPEVKSKLLEGDYQDRRMTYFTGMQDIKAKKAELEKILKRLVKLNTQ